MEDYTYDILYRVEATHWWFQGRRAIILDQIASRYRGSRSLTLLDVGCGTGIFLKNLQVYGHVIGLDVAAAALAHCKRREPAHLVQGDGIRLPFAEKTFDVVTANDFLEHLDDDVASLREIGRILKPDGRGFVFVPAYQFLWSLQDEISHHKRRYTAQRLSEAIMQAGLDLEYLTYANTFLFPVIFFGRQALKILRLVKHIETENDLHPGWANGLLTSIFRAEVRFLRHGRFPFGVSILAICRKPF